MGNDLPQGYRMTGDGRSRLARWRGFNLLEKFTADDSSKSVRFRRPSPARLHARTATRLPPLVVRHAEW